MSKSKGAFQLELIKLVMQKPVMPRLMKQIPKTDLNLRNKKGIWSSIQNYNFHRKKRFQKLKAILLQYLDQVDFNLNHLVAQQLTKKMKPKVHPYLEILKNQVLVYLVEVLNQQKIVSYLRMTQTKAAFLEEVLHYLGKVDRHYLGKRITYLVHLTRMGIKINSIKQKMPKMMRNKMMLMKMEMIIHQYNMAIRNHPFASSQIIQQSLWVHSKKFTKLILINSRLSLKGKEIVG